MKFDKFLILLVIPALLISCKPKADHSGKTVFKYNESSGIGTLDPAFARDQSIIWACNQLYNGLVQLNDSMQIVPAVAKSWNVSNDGKTYTFILRDDVFFHETEFYHFPTPRKVVASDFVYSFNRIVSSEVASPGQWIFASVDTNATGKPAFEAVNDTTFNIRLARPFPPFLGILTMQYCSVVAHEVVDKYGKDYRNHPVGTGPFQFKYWKEGVKLVLAKNPNYFEFENGQRLPFLDAVAITFIVDKQSVFMEFVKGNLDFLSGIDASYKDELLTSSGTLNPKYRNKFKLSTHPYLNTEYLGFLVDAGKSKSDNPLLKKEVRQAINYGFDRVKMIRFLRNNIGTPAYAGMVPQGLPSFDSSAVKGYSYQPQKAMELLAKAGYPNGKGMPAITLAASASYLDLCQYIQHELSKIGIELKIEVNPPATQREMISQSKLPFFRGSWIADYPDAENYLSLFYSKNFCPNGPNYTHFSNAEFDRLYEQSQNQVNDSLRYEVYKKMDAILMDEAPVVVLYYDKVMRLIQNNIEGLGNNSMNLLTLKRVKKGKR
jgi:peptide/nickel transport system substrate-binding protein